jgi:hypothetical protein
MDHPYSNNVAYKVKNTSNSIKLLKELEVAFPNLRWAGDGMNKPTKGMHLKENTYVIQNEKLYYSGTGYVPSNIKKTFNYIPDTLQEKIKKLKI